MERLCRPMLKPRIITYAFFFREKTPPPTVGAEMYRIWKLSLQENNGIFRVFQILGLTIEKNENLHSGVVFQAIDFLGKF